MTDQFMLSKLVVTMLYVNTKRLKLKQRKLINLNSKTAFFSNWRRNVVMKMRL